MIDDPWIKFSVDFFDDFAILELLEEHGAAGPLAFVQLMIAAKKEEWVHGPGNVIVSFSVLAAKLGVGVEEARAIVKDMRRLALIGVTSLGKVGFHATINRWEDHQPEQRPMSGAERVRAHRDRKTPSPELVTHVTDCNEKTLQINDIEERGKNNNNVEKVEEVVRPVCKVAGRRDLPPTENGTASADSGAVGELFDYWVSRCRSSGRGRPPILTSDRRTKIQGRLKDGYTPTEIRQAIDGAAAAAFVNEQGKRFDDIELICRNGSKLEDFMGRAETATSDAGLLRRLEDVA